ncbi:MAG: hypothetical protein FP814_09595 [Desulfobacterium sp.]|nr:hypothetical protein [Desulfobacterium sp.]MBU3947608.1 hypothetical protein [Pseudomonadota bacterium]MBU4009659.1 hypothetical protein [Pseudomonadota bacterium]MBU4036959.1 hypothetical protein [Pseudomonadota bacterium]
MWDLLNQLYKRFGLWALLFVALAFGSVWLVAHIVAPPCEKVSVYFGLIEYKKACGNPPGTKCQELRQHLQMNGAQQADLRHKIIRLESEVNKGNSDAQKALEESLGQLNALKEDGQNIEAQIQSQCPH